MAAPRGVTGDVARIVEALAFELEMTPGRAVFAELIVPLAERPALEAALGSLAPVPRIIEVDPNSSRLASLNFQRDLLARELRLVLVVVGDADHARLVADAAPDFYSFLDLVGHVRPAETPLEWAELADRLRARHRDPMLDTSDLLVDAARLPLRDYYLDLARFPQQNRRPRLLVGDPGAGATTWLRHLAADTARTALVPLLLPASALAQHGFAADPAAALVAAVRETLEIPGPGALADHLSELMLLVDDVDGLRGPEERTLMLRALARAARGRLGAVAATARAGVTERLAAGEDRAWNVGRLAPVRPRAGERWLRRLGEALGRDPATAAREALAVRRTLRREPGLGVTPLVLLFLAATHARDGGAAPIRRLALYRSISALVLARYRRGRMTRIAAGAGTNELERVLGLLGQALAASGPYASADALRGALAGAFAPTSATVDEAVARAESWLQTLMRGVLVPGPYGGWGFVHASLGDFYAGLRLSRDPSARAEALRDPFALPHREPLVFCAAVLGEERPDALPDLVAAVLRRARRARRDDAADVTTIAALLDIDPPFRPSDARRLIERVCARVWGTAWKHDASRGDADRAAVRLARVAPSRAWGLDLSRATARWLAPRGAPRVAPERFTPGTSSAPFAWVLPRLLERIDVDPSQLVDGWCGGPDPALAACGWAWRLDRAAPERQDAVLAAARAALGDPGFGEAKVTAARRRVARVFGVTYFSPNVRVRRPT